MGRRRADWMTAPSVGITVPFSDEGRGRRGGGEGREEEEEGKGALIMETDG